jgi:hypothetical protein
VAQSQSRCANGGQTRSVGSLISVLNEFAEEAQLAAASTDVRIVVIFVLALCVNLGAECDRTVLSALAFGDLELDGANSGGERVQPVN